LFAVAEGDGGGLRFAGADDGDKGDGELAGYQGSPGQRLVARVEPWTETRVGELVDEAPGGRLLIGLDGDDEDLLGGEPRREAPRRALEHDAEEALEAPEEGAVQERRAARA